MEGLYKVYIDNAALIAENHLLFKGSGLEDNPPYDPTRGVM